MTTDRDGAEALLEILESVAEKMVDARADQGSDTTMVERLRADIAAYRGPLIQGLDSLAQGQDPALTSFVFNSLRGVIGAAYLLGENSPRRWGMAESDPASSAVEAADELRRMALGESVEHARSKKAERDDLRLDWLRSQVRATAGAPLQDTHKFAQSLEPGIRDLMTDEVRERIGLAANDVWPSVSTIRRAIRFTLTV